MARYNLDVDSILCKKCNMKASREFKYAPVQESQSKCDVTDIKKKKELCFVPNCFSPVERRRSFDDYEKLCHYFNVTPAATAAQSIYLCAEHNCTFFNFSKKKSKYEMCSNQLKYNDRQRKTYQDNELTAAAKLQNTRKHLHFLTPASSVGLVTF
jgi:hypothetical protein